MVVVLMVVLQGRGAAGAQLCQSAAGGRQLGAEVGHFLTGRLDGPINALCQMFVVLHHFKDFPLRTKSTQSSMMSSGALERVKRRSFFFFSSLSSLIPPLLLLLIHLYAFSHSLLCTHVYIYISMKAPVLLLFSAEKLRDDLSSFEACRITLTHTQKTCVCVSGGQRREKVSAKRKNAKKERVERGRKGRREAMQCSGQRGK